jgi:hypothetical protein
MAQPAGSPRGTIHLYPDNVSEEEKEEKQDNRGSIGQELEEVQAKLATQQYLFLVYPQKIKERDIDGYYCIYINEIQPQKPAFKYYGTTYDFVEQFKHAIPMLENVVVNNLPMDIIQILAKEFPKYGIDLYTDEPIEEREEKEPNKPIDVDLDVLSKMKDPYHKGRGLKLSKIGRIARILKIAEAISQDTFYVRPATTDEEGSWVVAPKKPSNPDEPDAIKSFKTRDEAAKWLKEQDAKNEVVNSEDEEALNANLLHEWNEPEAATLNAWKLRKKGK